MTDAEHDSERDHLPSASGVDRLVNCPGSVAAQRAIPSSPEPKDDIAAQGSRIAAARNTGDVSQLTDEDLEIWQHLTFMENEAFEAWRAAVPLNKGTPQPYREERFWVRDRTTQKPVASAKIDWGYIHGIHALLGDDKTGYLDVAPAPSNWQLRTQAIAVWHEHPWLTHIRVAISQHRFRSKFDPCDYTAKDLQHAEEELFHSIWLSEQPDAPRRPGKWCDHCKAKAYCIEAAAYMMVARATIPGPANLKPLVEEAIGRLSSAQIGRLWQQKRISNLIWDAIEDRLRTMSDEDLNAIGLKYRGTGSTSTITDLNKAYATLYAKALVTYEEFLAACKLPITALEDIIATRLQAQASINRSAMRKDTAKREYRRLLADVTEVEAKQPSIVPLDG